MKALILGTDFLKDSDGNLRIIETNTNVDIHNDIISNLNWSGFEQLLVDNGITSIHFIATDGNAVHSNNETYAGQDVVNFTFKSKLEEIITNLNGNFEYYQLAKNSITVPYIEDADDKLIIRTSYDTSAIVDVDYATDKVNFHKLIESKPYTPNVYYKSESESHLNIDGLTSLHINDGESPNYVVKTRAPHINYDEYPKLYKIDTIEALTELKNSVTNLEFIEEFHINSENFLNNKIGVIRSLDIMYGNSLDLLHLGSYIMTARIANNLILPTYDSTGKMDNISRMCWISKFNKTSSKKYILDNDTPILYNDNTLKYPNQILQGDVVKTIKFPWVSEDENHTPDTPDNISGVTSGSFDVDMTTFTQTTASVVGLESEEMPTLMIEVTLENGIVYQDLPSSAMVIEEFDTLNTTFVYTNKFRINDSIVFFDYNNNTLTKSKITNLEIKLVSRTLYQLDVETNDIFLPVADETLGLTFIQHNPYCEWWCAPDHCGWIWSCSACWFCDGGPSK